MEPRGGVGIEELRVALQRYRRFFGLSPAVGGATAGGQSISAKKTVTPPVAKFGMSLTAAWPSSDPKPA